MENVMDCKCMVLFAFVSAFGVLGCGGGLTFPLESDPSAAKAAGAYRAYDCRRNGRADFFCFARPDGRINVLGYDHDSDGRIDTKVSLDAIDFAQCRHLVLILDGVSHDLVREYYAQGHLRMFHPPSRVIAPYPSMTDVAMESLFGYVPCRGFEAVHFDRLANRLVGGSMAYLTSKNAAYNQLLTYRASMLWDAIGYVAPGYVYRKEIRDTKKLFDRRASQEVLAYFVSSAGLGTRQGADGHRQCLRQIEQLVLQVLHETRGMTKITLLADHGHCYTPLTRIPLERHLESKGWHPAERLRGERDVVCIPFGLVTFASLATNSPAKVAADLTDLDGVDLVTYADGRTAVVLGGAGATALIRERNGRFRYEPVRGDPLVLKTLLANVSADADGYRPADALARATAEHVYPAPLQRIWRAHFALIENPPDVIVSLTDEYFYGSSAFSRAVRIASTHGSLNYKNSVTFLMSTAAALPPVLQSKDVPAAMKRLTADRWPSGR
jgi:hypothetical protein